MANEQPPTTTWRAVCGVDMSIWKVEGVAENPAPTGSFCPDCRERRMTAPGVLHWVPDPVKEATHATETTGDIAAFRQVAGLVACLCVLCSGLGFLVGAQAQAPSRQWFTAPDISAVPSNRTVPRTLASSIAPILNIKDFGAIGDGVTDDTVAYENCWMVAKREGRPVAVDDGHYLIHGKVMDADEIVRMAMKDLQHAN